MLTPPLQVAGGAIFVGFIMVIVTIVTIISSIETIDETETKGVFVFGTFEAVLKPGLNFVPPFVSDVRPLPTDLQTVEVTIDDVETADGTPCSVRAAVDVRVVDVEAAFTETDDYQSAFTDLARSLSRDVVRSHDFDRIRDDRRQLEETLQDDLAAAVEAWGLVVPAVELDVTPAEPTLDW